MEARAVITAQDKTGEAFAAIQKKIDSLSRASREVGRASRSVSSSLGGVSAQAESIDRASRSIGRYSSAMQSVARVSTAITTAMTAMAAYKGADVVRNYAKFDDLIRYQKAVADLSAAERDSRVKQAVHLGGSSSFNDLQVLEAQLTLSQRGVNKAFVEPFIEEMVHFAQAMNTDLPNAAKTLESIIFSTGQNVDDAATASKVMRQNIDLAVKAAKLGGLDNEGIAEAFKFGGATAHGAGFSNATMAALFASLHRAGFQGSEAGVATRAIASHLVAPTSKGLDALGAMGIDFNKFTTMPGGASPAAVDAMMRRKFGKSLSPAQAKKFAGIFGDSETFSDPAKFVTAATEAVLDSFPKTKKGAVSAKDRQAIAKNMQGLWKMLIQSVDVAGLLKAILDAHPTIGQANALVTDKHGGKLTALAEKASVFNDIFEQLEHVRDGFAKEIGDERMAGFSGALKRAAGAILNFETAIGRANDAMMTSSVDRFAQIVQHIAELDPSIVKLGTEIAAIAAGMTAIKAAGLLSDGFGLKGSAAALDGAAAALQRAAVVLGGGHPGGPGAPGGSGGSGGQRRGSWFTKGLPFGTAIDMLFNPPSERELGAGPNWLKKLPWLRDDKLGGGAGIDLWHRLRKAFGADPPPPDDFTLGSDGTFQPSARYPAGRFHTISRKAQRDIGNSPMADQPVVARLEGQADVRVVVEASGELKRLVTLAQSISSSGNLSAKVGSSMPEASAAGRTGGGGD